MPLTGQYMHAAYEHMQQYCQMNQLQDTDKMRGNQERRLEYQHKSK